MRKDVFNNMKKNLTRKLFSLALAAFFFIAAGAGGALMIGVDAADEEAVWGTNTEYSGGIGTLSKALEVANVNTSGTTYIKLLRDVNTTKPVEINTGKTVDIDLAGYKIDRGLASSVSNGSVITVSGTLTLSDSSAGKTGKITGGNNSNYGGGAYVSGTLTIKGGSIVNNRSQTNGGGIYGTAASKIVFESGEIVCNESRARGGGIYTDGMLEIKGGAITSNTAATAPGGVYFGATYGLVLSGSPVIKDNVVGGTLNNLELTGGTRSNIYVQSKSLTIGSGIGLTAGAEIWVSSATPPTDSYSYPVTSINSANYSGYFKSDNPKYIIENVMSGSNFMVAIGLQEAIWGGDASYSVDGGTLVEAIAYAQSLSAGSTAYIYLQKNVALASAIDIPASKTVRLDLNGKTLKRSLSSATANGHVISVSGSLILEDSATGAKITGGYSSGTGGGILVYSDGILQINGGSITGNRALDGGGIYLSDNSELIFTSGSITNNGADKNGGGIYAGFSSATIGTAPVISGNSAKLGGGIYMMADATLDLAGTIRNNSADTSGGGIYAGGNIRVFAAAYVFDNKRGGVANNIFLPTGKTVGINLSTGLYGTARLGVSTEATPTSVTPIPIISPVSYNYSGYFSSDNSAFGIKNTGSGSSQVLMLSVQSVAVGELTGGTLTRRTSATGLKILVTTTNISNGTVPSITWYNNASKSQYGDSYRPSSVTMTASSVNNNSVTLTINSGSSASAGDYYFTVTIDGIESDIKILRVGRTKLNIPHVTATYYYTGYEQTAAITGFASGTMAVVSGNKQKAVGIDYRIILKLIDPTQYEWANGNTDNQSIYWSIFKGSLTKPTAAGPNIYKGVDQSALLQNFNSSQMNIIGNIQKDVGTYTLAISIKDAANYQWADNTNHTITLEWKIDKAPLTVRANDISIVYGDPVPTYTASYSGLVGGDTVSSLIGTTSITCSYIRNAKAGTYQINVGGLSSKSYEITFVNGSLTVTKKPVMISWSNTEFPYDGKAHQPTAELLNYSGSGRINVSGAMVNAGSYTAQAVGFVDENHALSNSSASFRITKIPLTVKANDCAIVYGEVPSGNGVSYNGFVNGEVGGVLSGILEYSFDYKQYDAVGSSYKATPSGLSSVNYTITFVPATLTVKKADVSLTIEDVASVSGDETLTYKLTEGAFVNGDEKHLALTREPGDAPGVYSITAELDSANYDCKITAGKYTILQTALTSPGGILMSSSTGLDPNIRLTVTEIDKKSISDKIPDGRAIAAYDISLTNNSIKVQPDGRLTINIPDKWLEKYEKIAVVHIDSTGKAEYLSHSRANGTLTVTVDNLSTFAIVDLDVDYTWVLVAAAAAVVLLGGGFCVYLFAFRKRAA